MFCLRFSVQPARVQRAFFFSLISLKLPFVSRAEGSIEFIDSFISASKQRTLKQGAQPGHRQSLTHSAADATSMTQDYMS